MEERAQREKERQERDRLDKEKKERDEAAKAEAEAQRKKDLMAKMTNLHRNAHHFRNYNFSTYTHFYKTQKLQVYYKYLVLLFIKNRSEPFHFLTKTLQ